MQSDEPAHPPASQELLDVHQVRPAAPLVLRQVVSIRRAEPLEQPARQPAACPPSPGPLPGNLKIDQVRPAVLAHDDVLALLQVHVSDPTSVHRPQKVCQPVEEVVRHAFAALQIVAGNELVHEAGRPEPAEESRHAFQVAQLLVEPDLSRDQPATQPLRRQAQEIRRAAHLQHRPARRSFVEPAGSEEIVLERSDQPILRPVQPESFRQPVRPQGPQVRVRLTLALACRLVERQCTHQRLLLEASCPAEGRRSDNPAAGIVCTNLRPSLSHLPDIVQYRTIAGRSAPGEADGRGRFADASV